eukprot:9214548-Pyramimonas_sp.AAC.1
MASNDPANAEHKQIIDHVRRARALYMTGKNDEYCELNVAIWAYWADRFPAYIKQRHYQRGLSAFLWWSGNDAATDGNSMKLDQHRARAPVSAEYENRWLSSPGNVVLTLPEHVKVDISRCVDVLNCFRSPTVMGSGKAHQWELPEKFDEHMNEMIQ